MGSEEKEAIKQNLIANSLISVTYNVDSNKIEYKINQNGLTIYATILKLLDKNQIINGIYMDKASIETNYLHVAVDTVLREEFCIFAALKHECLLTNRGMEHIKVMFELDSTPTNTGKFRKLFSRKG